ncbi:phosphoribosylamine--glycine ligase [candidate division KSB1 bacterium]|nr:phosphoribosylamine--glycine ligase [candidate division KSB1 bacterium]
MKILVVGGGGREHALAWKLKSSPLIKKVFCAPGNVGMMQHATCEDIAVDDLPGLVQFAKRQKIDLTIVGPEQPLVDGIVDLFEKHGLAIYGPNRAAAELEGSKAFTKNLLAKYGIPTADYRVFQNYDKAVAYINQLNRPAVIKADGLAAGKGVIVCTERAHMQNALQQMMQNKRFGHAGNRVVVEAYLQGEEVSLLGLSDGEHLMYLAPAQDHKRISDGDEGLNTGGMGAYAPTPFLDEAMIARIKREIMEPTIRAMASEGRPYKGVLYAGLMLTEQGPKVLEFNCRFGDPETQVILPVMTDDLLAAILAAQEGKLHEFERQETAGFAAGVVMASAGYPEKYQTGKVILGLNRTFESDVVIFHSGTRRQGNQIVTAGGRILTVTAKDDSLKGAIDKAYRTVGQITFEGAYYRKDIGAKGLRPGRP